MTPGGRPRASWSTIVPTLLTSTLLTSTLLAVAPIQAVDGAEPTTTEEPSFRLVVLGVGQDAGVPQAGSTDHPGWDDASLRRFATSLAVFDGEGRRWLFEATPDFKYQLAALDRIAPRPPGSATPVLAGVFLTHAHIGHYTGLMMLGHESMGAQRVPVHAMPRMAEFLRTNGPWSQLVRYENIVLHEMAADRAVVLDGGLTVTPFLVPHRQEFSEVVGYRITGPAKTVLFIPDIDRWEDWDQDLATVLAGVDVAYVDATFYANGEIPGRDMSGFPHPFITTTMDRLQHLDADERAKVRFIHLNHTNPALYEGPERAEILRRGFRVAEEGELLDL